jgi:hypothetical protein
MFNGINVTQTHNYIKINCHSFIEKACKKYLMTWMHTIPITDNQLTPLPTDQNWLKKFNAAVGSSNKDDQDCLAEEMKLTIAVVLVSLFRQLQPAILTLLSQASNCLIRTCIPMSIATMALAMPSNTSDGLHFWCTSLCMELPAGPIPQINSNRQDLLLDVTPPDFNVTTTHIYLDSNWATCVMTHHSFTGICICLAGGTNSYKTRLQ